MLARIPPPLTLLAFLALLSLSSGFAGVVRAQQPPSSASYDVVVYGGTDGGVTAAIAAAQEGGTVVLLEPGRHVGGMLTGGLGRTDMDRQQHVIGGFAREFFVRAGRHYGDSIAWTFEPSVAEHILNDWLREAGVPVLFGHRLDTVEKEGSRIVRIRMENGAAFTGRVFIDASYEGDLMARAGVSYTIGREGREQYGEPNAGRKEFQPVQHQLLVPVSPFDAEGNLLPYVVDGASIGDEGSADDKVQAYCFRLCLTDVPENRIPITRPADYDPARYELLRRYLIKSDQVFRKTLFPLGLSRMPNGKTDVNSRGPISTNLLGASWEYPDASYERRREIWDEHLSWTHGLLYFLGNDPALPDTIRREMKRWGLSKDEFQDTGHWPHQLYVREGRRMLGEYVMTQHDLQTRRRKYDTIGMGGYNMDVREVQWVARRIYSFPENHWEVAMEGYISIPVEPYEIPYRSLLPRQEETSNLLVTATMSASHMAYSSIRMEPQYMIMGQSAGVAAALAARSGAPVHNIDVAELQRRLLAQGQILSLGE